MKILHVDCSPRLESHSRALSAALLDTIKAVLVDVDVCRRDIGYESIPHIQQSYALTLTSLDMISQASESVMAPSETLIREVEMADVIVIGTPMYNCSLPSVLKAWFDQILRVGRTINTGPAGKYGVLKDKPVYVGIASGGYFRGKLATQPDFLTPYIEFALGSIGISSIQFFALEGTASLDLVKLESKIAAELSSLDILILPDSCVLRK